MVPKHLLPSFRFGTISAYQDETRSAKMVLKFTNDVTTFHRIDVDGHHVVEVFGDGDNGSYEFRIIGPDGGVHIESNVGYGLVAYALRDGLNWALGED